MTTDVTDSTNAKEELTRKVKYIETSCKKNVSNFAFKSGQGIIDITLGRIVLTNINAKVTRQTTFFRS